MKKMADGTICYFPLDHQTEIACVWFLSYSTGDTMAMVFRDGQTAPWKMVWRERIYKDDKVINSKDEREGHMVTAKADDASRDRLVRTTDALILEFKAIRNAKLTRVDQYKTADQFTRWWMTQRSAHVVDVIPFVPGSTAVN